MIWPIFRISTLSQLAFAVNDLNKLLVFNEDFTKRPVKKDQEPYDMTNYWGYFDNKKAAFRKFYMFCFQLVKPEYAFVFILVISLNYWSQGLHEILTWRRRPPSGLFFWRLSFPSWVKLFPSWLYVITQYVYWVIDLCNSYFPQENPTKYKATNKDLWSMVRIIAPWFLIVLSNDTNCRCLNFARRWSLIYKITNRKGYAFFTLYLYLVFNVASTGMAYSFGRLRSFQKAGLGTSFGFKRKSREFCWRLSIVISLPYCVCFAFGYILPLFFTTLASTVFYSPRTSNSFTCIPRQFKSGRFAPNKS